MHIHQINIPPATPAPAVTGGKGDIARSSAVDEAFTATPAASNAPGAALSPETLASALMGLGLAADKENLALADLFARLGVPLTESNLTQARVLLSRYAGTPPTALALAKTIDMEPSAAVLRALSSVIQGLPEGQSLPPEVVRLLGMAVDSGQIRDSLAAQLKSIIGRLGQSTEFQILQITEEGAGALGEDLRSALLNLVQMTEARSIRIAADSHAAFIEGQQLLNQIALLRFDPPVPLYFAFGAFFGQAEPSMVELQVWSHDEKSAPSEDDDDKPYMQTIVRVAPPRLGMIETKLIGTRAGSLRCELAAEKPATYRLLRREAGDLAQGLSEIGWDVRGMNIRHQQQFVPLWYGGDAVSAPRARLDRRV
jgi:hypothetical protein